MKRLISLLQTAPGNTQPSENKVTLYAETDEQLSNITPIFYAAAPGTLA